MNLRPPASVMKAARLGAFHQSRLSFMRQLLRRLKAENWQFQRPLWTLDSQGVGRAVYTATGPQRSYSLVAFAHDLDPALRSDRVIATAWDATFALFDGVPDAADLDRLEANVPKQEAGRISSRELCMARANRSVRLFDHVIEALAAGRQPQREFIDEVGYLMRTTAVYGSGKFGAADRESIAQRPELAAPFQAEMLTVFLIRAFTLDLVEHLAQARAPRQAVPLEPQLRRRLGIGNSTGLGMAPFLLNHPVLLNNWVQARETALQRVRAVRQPSAAERQRFVEFLTRAQAGIGHWHSEHELQHGRILQLQGDLQRLEHHLASGILEQDSPWDELYRWAEGALSLEAQECLVSLLLEPYGHLVDELGAGMQADEQASFSVDGSMSIGRLRQILDEHYSWVAAIDFSSQASRALFWYVSEEKLEPRIGQRFAEPGQDLEQPLAVARDIAQLQAALPGWSDAQSVASFLLRHPEYRHSLRRVQLAPAFPYADIQDNLIDQALLPIDLLRCKLSFFGATHFDPRSDRWVRITLYQNAPFPHELGQMAADDWSYPNLDSQEQRRACLVE
ncbi:hypothetical protein SAMN03159355_02886 [Pseudomonas sp. NFPP10]|uniref:hypothetical protein n=1 Tax=Pseudomonas TaxID=286 RepID=UPI00087F9DE8|nr:MULTISPECIES: hypothetical protein [Pseudomonas]POA91486.1 hypothetical protein C1883_04540 [Pseudomonas protegens]SDA23719.1 hypothetical protein SAMN03159465_03354 [Pseudomonas sp. NFPP12]SEL59062.1 hypothetical protein SAMN03159355_02886 [Pseudomonas sp. NFPP10]SFJ28461.1 hypothetical protein SAMN03159416_03303 [Pseudomonas sp. NFPP08]SFM79423.1 hypothetical protein SAMN03159476_02936 [Pseudomonas sp. NFPP05]